MKLKPILNRGASGDFILPADNWYLVAPLGTWSHAESGLTQIVDGDAVNTMASAFRPGRDELLVDFDHESADIDKRTTAAGWIVGLASRADGLWAQIRWSKSGLDSLTGGEFRFISPVWLTSDVEFLDGNRIRPLRLDSAGLTNRPNMKLPALSNRSEEAAVVKGQEMQPTLTTKDDPVRRWDSLVKSVAARHRIPYDAAWSRAILDHPDDYAQLLYVASRQENAEWSAKNIHSHISGSSPHPALKSQATLNRGRAGDTVLENAREAAEAFENRVRDMMRSGNRSYSDAYDRCQINFPSDYARLTVASVAFRNRIQPTKAV